MPTALLAQTEPVTEQFLKRAAAACPQLVSRLVASPGFVAATSARPVSQQAVCGCADSRFAADPRLKEALSGDPQAVMARVQTDAFKGYVGVRVVETTLACLVIELEASASAIMLPR
jgi:hypothetical protein